MNSRLDRLTSCIRWAVIAWIAYCAFQAIRWWNFDMPALVLGWSWIGSVWGCMLCMISRSPVRRNDWGARIAVFAPTLLVMCVFFRGVWLDLEFDVGPVWLWPVWNLVLDFAVLAWGWELRGRLVRVIRYASAVVWLGGIAAAFSTSESYVSVFVVGLAIASVTLLRNNQESPRPLGLTLSVALLAAVDLGLLAFMTMNDQYSAGWGLLTMVRTVAQTFVGYRISSSHRGGTEVITVSRSGSWTQLPTRTIQGLVFSTLIAWTCFVCWLYPRCVATCFDLNGNRDYQFTTTEPVPDLLSDSPLLAKVWLASRLVHDSLHVQDSDSPIPEYMFAIGEVEEVVTSKITDATLASLHRFPNLTSVVVFDATEISVSGLEVLASLTKLRSLVIHRLNALISDFSCFSSHLPFEVQLHGRISKADPEMANTTRDSVVALSRMRSVSLTIESTCDDELARLLCEIKSIRTLSLYDVQGISGSTLLRLVDSHQLEMLVLSIRHVGKSITFAEIAEAADKMPIDTILHLDSNDMPVTEADILALERLGKNSLRFNRQSELAPENRRYSPFGVEVRLTIEGDDAFRQLCRNRSLNSVEAKVREVSELGLATLSHYPDWKTWTISFDFTNLKCAAREWTNLIPRSLVSQIIITPESIQTSKDVAGLRDLLHETPKSAYDKQSHIHVVCDQPAVATLERLKRLTFPAQLVIDLSTSALTNSELMEYIEAIPTAEFDIDLRLPRSTVFTANNSGPLAALDRFAEIRLEIDLADSAMPELAKLPGLFDLDLRDSSLSPHGLAWLQECDSLETLHIRPGSHTSELLRIIGRCSVNLDLVRLIDTPIDNDLWNSLRFVEEGRNQRNMKRRQVIRIAITDVGIDHLLGSVGDLVLITQEGRYPTGTVFERPIQTRRTRIKSSD